MQLTDKGLAQMANSGLLCKTVILGENERLSSSFRSEYFPCHLNSGKRTFQSTSFVISTSSKHKLNNSI
ncbi:Uncharacterized protein TCM_005013 [Theobroma cacao]|uniref:Uncharacterized protein n=1 Tax=Theobroma cacao TaxID=3641 RepID=A0A061DS39_THECC|nr:Uncharacterized protein TCM_005013 [Theobroma cacao]